MFVNLKNAAAAIPAANGLVGTGMILVRENTPIFQGGLAEITAISLIGATANTIVSIEWYK